MGKVKGTSPVSSDKLADCYEFMVDLCVEWILKETKSARHLSTYKFPDYPSIGMIHALRVLVEAHRPRAVFFYFTDDDVESWRAMIMGHLEKHKNKIPVKYRKGFIQSVKDDFDFLAAMCEEEKQGGPKGRR